VAAKVFLERYFASPDSPKSATVKIERFWGTMREATDACMLASGLDQCYRFYAIMFVIHVYNRSMTAANKIDPGEAPYRTLGLDEELQKLVPFGNPCTVAKSPT